MDGPGARAAQEARWPGARSDDRRQASGIRHLPDWATMGRRIVQLAQLLTFAEAIRTTVQDVPDRPEVAE
jgi:hypothetical protein